MVMWPLDIWLDQNPDTWFQLVVLECYGFNVPPTIRSQIS